MQKTAQQIGGRPVVDVKRDELKKMVSDTLTQLDTTMQQTMGNLTKQVTNELNNIIQNLSKEVDVKLNEIKSLQAIPAQPGVAPAADDYATKKAYYQGGAGANEPGENGKPKYKSEKAEPIIPRGDGEDLQMFWKDNFDYGYGPYTNLDKMEGKEITDYKHTLNKNDGRHKKQNK